MSDIYLAVSETPTVVTLTSAVINSAVASSVTVMNTVTVSLASVPTHAISGTVTASVVGTSQNGNFYSLPIAANNSTVITRGVAIGWNDTDDDSFYNVSKLKPLPISSPYGVYISSGSVTASISGTVPISISSVTVGNFPATQPISISSVTIGNFPATQAISIASVTVGNSVTIGSLPAISGTVTANIGISSTAITSGSFTSLTSATLVPGNTARKMATVYNLGPGQLFVNAGATATTLGGGFMVALSSSDYLECDYTTTTLSALFATAGTASWVSH